MIGPGSDKNGFHLSQIILVKPLNAHLRDTDAHHHCAFSTDYNLFTKAIFFYQIGCFIWSFILDGINFYQGHIFAFSKRLLWLVGNLQFRLVKPLHAHHGHVPGDDEVEVMNRHFIIQDFI